MAYQKLRKVKKHKRYIPQDKFGTVYEIYLI